jgi:CDP-diacylglycerol pyrophosphatase
VWIIVSMCMKMAQEAYQPLDEVTFKKAAYAILKQSTEPLHYTQITKIAIETGYWRKQDEEFIKQHMYQAIKTDIRKKKSASLFEEVAPATYQINKYALNS